jgi:putative endonuclease
MQLARGREWEARAATYLERHGLTILARGYRCRLGELDLVCRDDREVVIV